MAVNRTARWDNHMYSHLTKEEREVFQYFILMPIIVFLLFSIFGNSLVIAAFFRDSRLKVVFNLFVVHLAAADIVLSFIVILALVDELTQVSLLGAWSPFCQLCTVLANAVPIEQLILVHIMCHDRHKALLRGMSYTRTASHWHIEKLVLFSTWVITLVGSFLMTDLTSSVKLFGIGSCKSPGRLLYMSYTSFLHFALLVSLTVAVMCIAWDFRKRRKGSQFERLSAELENDSPFLQTCRSSANSQQNKQSVQSLIPRSPLQAFRNFLSFPSPDLHRPTCLSQTLLLTCDGDVQNTHARHDAQITYLKNSSISDELPACSYAQISPEALRRPPVPHLRDQSLLDEVSASSYAEISADRLSINMHGIQGPDYHEKLSSVDLDESLINVGDQYKDDEEKRRDKYRMYVLYSEKFRPKSPFYSTDTTRLYDDVWPFDTTLELGQEPELYGTEDQRLWPLHAESQLRVSGGGFSGESVEAKDDPAVKTLLVNKGKSEHCTDNQTGQTSSESSEDTDERAFVESLEDLLPVSVSLSDDELDDVPQLQLRPRTDSLYTLRSCLSVSEESLSKPLSEAKDVSSQSEVSASNGMPNGCLNSRKGKRNDNRLFTIGDEEEEQREVNVVSNTRTVQDLFSRTFPIRNLPEYVLAASIHCQENAPSYPANPCNEDSPFSTQPKMIHETENKDIEKHHSTSKSLSAGEHFEACLSSDISMVKIAANCNNIPLQELSEMPSVEPEPVCPLAVVDIKVHTHLEFPNNENTTTSEGCQTLSEQTPHTSHKVVKQCETTHPPEKLEFSEACKDKLKNNSDNDNEDDNNNAGKRKEVNKNINSPDLGQENDASHTSAYAVSGENIHNLSLKNNSNNKNEDENNNSGKRKEVNKNLKSPDLGQQQNDASYTSACAVSGESVHNPGALINESEMTEQPLLSAKTRQSTNEMCVSIQSVATDRMKTPTLEEYDHVKFNGRNIQYKYDSEPGHIPNVRARDMKDSKFNADSLTNDMTYFDILSAGSCEYVDNQLSQRDIESAVESWFKFYDISPEGLNHLSELEIAQGRKCVEKCRFPQCKHFKPQPGHSMMCNSLVRARQIWLDFYGIQMVEKYLPEISHQPNGHLMSVPVEVHADGSHSCDDSAVSEQADEDIECKHQKHGLLCCSTQVDEVKMGKRLKRGIRSKNERSSSGCEAPAMLDGHIGETELETVETDFKQNGGTSDNQQGSTKEEFLHSSVSEFNSQGINYNIAWPGDVSIPKESCQTLQPFNFVNQTKTENDLPKLPSHRRKSKRIDKSLEDNSALSVEKSLSAQNTEKSSKPSCNCTQASAFPKSQTVPVEETNILDYTTCKPAVGKASSFTCVFPLENGAGFFECYCKELEDEVEEKPRVDYNIGKEFVNNLVNATDKVGLRKRDELETSSIHGEIHFENTSSKQDEDQLHFTEQTHRKCLMDIARSSECENNISLLDTSVAQGISPGETNYHFIKSQSMESCVLGKDGQGGGTEVTVTAYQMLESLSITWRAWLAEIGIYQDIVDGGVPLSEEVICKKDKKWIIPCPECERRQQEKLQKVSGTAPGSAPGNDAASGGGAGAGEAGEASENSLTDAQANNSSGLDQLTTDKRKSERRSALGSEYSSFNMEMLNDVEEIDTTRISIPASRTDNFISMVRSLPGRSRTMSGIYNVEELKRRDPELCILLNLICIVVLQLICWYPIVILYMMYDVTEFPPTPNDRELTLLWLWCSRMTMQPGLYAYFSKYFLQNYIELVLCQRR